MRLSGSRWIVCNNNPVKNDLLVMLVDSVRNTLKLIHYILLADEQASHPVKSVSRRKSPVS